MTEKRENFKILIVIPARGGSVGVPKKNIKMVNGKPLIAYAIEAALASKYGADVIVSTDDENIAAVAKKYGAKVPFLRPDHLSGSNTTLVLVSKHALEYYESENVFYDAILSLQPTAPLITTKTIDSVIQTFLESDCTSVITVSEFMSGHPYTAKRISEDGDVSNFIEVPEGAVTFPRQKREKAYFTNGAIYLREAALVHNYTSGGWQLGDKPKAVIMDESESIDINTELDLKLAELVLSNKQGN